MGCEAVSASSGPALRSAVTASMGLPDQQLPHVSVCSALFRALAHPWQFLVALPQKVVGGTLIPPHVRTSDEAASSSALAWPWFCEMIVE